MHQLAQLNIAAMKGPLESPLMADFVANLDRINALAESSPGYVWRMKTDEGNATALRPFGDEVLVNLSVWQDLETLRDFVFGAEHVEIMRQRGRWFERMAQAYVVFWWVPAGHRPTTEEARERLEHLHQWGPSERAFTFRNPFPAPDISSPPPARPFPDECPAA
jgi:hypothetical protein